VWAHNRRECKASVAMGGGLQVWGCHLGRGVRVFVRNVRGGGGAAHKRAAAGPYSFPHQHTVPLNAQSPLFRWFSPVCTPSSPQTLPLWTPSEGAKPVSLPPHRPPPGPTSHSDVISAAGAVAAASVLPGNQCSTNKESHSSSDTVRKPPLAKCTVLVLREECTSNGISIHGKKDDLIARLREFYESQAARALDKAGAPSAPVAAPPGTQAPMFTKHEFTRLFHVMAMPNIAEGIVASRGALSRQQIDAGVAEHD